MGESLKKKKSKKKMELMDDDSASSDEEDQHHKGKIKSHKNRNGPVFIETFQPLSKITDDLPIKQKIDYYLDSKASEDPLKMFMDWSFEGMASETKKWLLSTSCLYVYIVSDHYPGRRLRASIGCVADLALRLQQRKGPPQGRSMTPPDISTTSRKPKRISSAHKLMFWLRVPPVRNYSSKTIKDLIDKKRGWKSKCSEGIKIANWLGLEWKITSDIKNDKTSYYCDELNLLAMEKGGKKNIYF